MINMKKKVDNFLDAPLTIRRELKMCAALYGAMALAWVAALIIQREKNKKEAEKKVKIYGDEDLFDL